MHRHTGPAPSVIVWGGIGFHCRTPLVRIAGTLNSQGKSLSCWSPWSFHTFSTCYQPYSNRIMHDHMWHARLKVSLSIRFNFFLIFLACSPDRSITNRKYVARACTTTGVGYTNHCYTGSTLAKCESRRD
ncbi:hypothetical protein TNCV_2946031 [Trichonephila clavipes]|nr:hypothetical protein TNCV_2946031 [Trichonephila clavipes]